MGFFDFLKGADINQSVEEWKSSGSGILVDVRTPEEYRGGHIPGSINIPLDEIRNITAQVPDKTAQLFVHCLSGARSAQAVSVMKQFGYTNVKNIGGISAWRGKVVK